MGGMTPTSLLRPLSPEAEPPGVTTSNSTACSMFGQVIWPTVEYHCGRLETGGGMDAVFRLGTGTGGTRKAGP